MRVVTSFRPLKPLAPLLSRCRDVDHRLIDPRFPISRFLDFPVFIFILQKPSEASGQFFTRRRLRHSHISVHRCLSRPSAYPSQRFTSPRLSPLFSPVTICVPTQSGRMAERCCRSSTCIALRHAGRSSIRRGASTHLKLSKSIGRRSSSLSAANQSAVALAKADHRLIDVDHRPVPSSTVSCRHTAPYSPGE